MPDIPETHLYWSPGTCARVPFVALEEAGVPFELHVINRYIGDHQTEEYKRLNPKQRVPTLVLDDWVVTEIPVMTTVLDQTFPEGKLLPEGDRRSTAYVLSTMAWFASGIQPAVGRQRFPKAFTDSEDCTDSIRVAARRQLEGSFSILEDRLGGRDWLFGDWSIVDVHLLWLWFRAVGSGMEASRFPRCAAHAERTEARPSVARVLDREEEEFARFEAAGTVPDDIPPFQVGRTPPSA